MNSAREQVLEKGTGKVSTMAMLSPIDIEQQRFQIAWRGYDKEQVHRFLGLVAEQTAQLLSDTRAFEGQVLQRDQELRALLEREGSLKQAMIDAQNAAAAEVREAARKDAQTLLQSAERAAQKVVQQAQHYATKIRQDTLALAQQRLALLEEMRGLVNTHARLLDVMDSSLPPGPEADKEALASVLDRLQAPQPPGDGTENTASQARSARSRPSAESDPAVGAHA